MHKLLDLFLIFFKLYPISFGGGYVMLPYMSNVIESRGWLTVGEISDIIAIAGMSPGSVAINGAIGLGYKVAGMPGAVSAFLGITLPTIIIVSIMASIFFKIYHTKGFQAAFYGLRPVITGVIAYAGVSFAIKNSIIYFQETKIMNGIYFMIGKIGILEVKSFLIVAASILLIIKYKVHPIYIIVGAGLLGMVIF